MRHCIYLLDWTHAGGKQYVGMTVDLPARVQQHRSQPSNKRVEQAWKQFGEPVVSVLHDGLSMDSVQEVERREIAARECYNIIQRPAPAVPIRRFGRPAMEGRRPRVACVLDSEHLTKLTAMAAEKACSVSTLVREAVILYLRERAS